MFDAEVVDGLVYAYRARKELQLPDATGEGIRDAITRTARGKFWRYPTIRLNQVNWYSLMYAADATVTGSPALLKRDMSLQLRRFFNEARPGGASKIGNFGPGLRFHYLPHMPLNVDKNVDSAEYANIVLTFTRFYAQARRAGMPRPARDLPRARPAVDRAGAQWLLDPRRVPELGLRPRLRPLAAGQEVRAHAAGADRRRHGASFLLPGPEFARGRSTCSIAASSSTGARADARRTGSRTRRSSTCTPSPGATGPPGSPSRA